MINLNKIFLSTMRGINNKKVSVCYKGNCFNDLFVNIKEDGCYVEFYEDYNTYEQDESNFIIALDLKVENIQALNITNKGKTVSINIQTECRNIEVYF